VSFWEIAQDKPMRKPKHAAIWLANIACGPPSMAVAYINGATFLNGNVFEWKPIEDGASRAAVYRFIYLYLRSNG
jgi:hypothetical protein